MKAIKGLEDRLYALDQMIASCGRLVNEQKELAQVLYLAIFVYFKCSVYLCTFIHFPLIVGNALLFICVLVKFACHYDYITNKKVKGKEVYLVWFQKGTVCSLQ